MQWKPDATSGMVVWTPFAHLEAFRVTQDPRKRVPDAYAARVLGVGRRLMASRIDFSTLEAAQRWAEQEYVRLLRVELASIL